MARLTMLHIVIIGVVIMLILGGGMWFFMITPAQDEQKKAATELQAVKDRAAKLSTAKAALAKAQKEAASAKADYAVFEQQYMPMLRYDKDRMVNMIRNFWPNNGKSWPERFRKTVTTYMNSESRKTGIRWDNPGVLVMGPYGPNPNTIDAGRAGEGLGPVLHYDLPMQIQARNVSSIMKHIRNWPNIRGAGVPVASNLQIEGNSPNLSARYQLTLTIIVRDEIPKEDGRVGGSGGSGGGNQFGGGGNPFGGGGGGGGRGGPAPGLPSGGGGGGGRSSGGAGAKD